MNSDDLSGAVGKWVQPPDGTTERDAARYRWLRDPSNAADPAWDAIIDCECSAASMDALIDEAMSEAVCAEPSMSTTSPPENSGTDYTYAISEAGQRYMEEFAHAHPLPAQFRWEDLWNAMKAAAQSIEGGAKP